MSSYLEAHALISSNIVNASTQLRNLVAELAEDESRTSMLSKLVWGALQGLADGMPDGINSIDMLLAADILAGWAVHELAKSSNMDESVMYKGWVLALAIRHELMAQPTLADTLFTLRRKNAEPS